MDQEKQQTPEQQDVESDAAFAAGYAQARGTEVVPQVTTPEKTEAPQTGDEKVVPESKAAPVEDEWKDVPSKVKTEFESMRARLTAIDTIPEQMRKLQGQVGGLVSHTKELKDALAKAKDTTEAKGGTTPTQQQVDSAAKDAAQWEQLKADFPDWAEAVDARLAKIEATRATTSPVDTAAIEARIAAETEKRVAQATSQAVAEARLLAPIDAKHLGWEETIVTEPFLAWEKKQGAEVQAYASSSNPQDVIRMLDLYSVFSKKTAEKAEERKRLDANVTPSGTTVTPSTTSDDDAFEQGYNEARSR